jgi:hypothetical protein
MEPMLSFLGPVFDVATRIYDYFSGRKSRRVAACAAFRETFQRELQGLYPIPTDWPAPFRIEQRLERVYPVLQAAVATFKAYVPEKDRQNFDKAWMYYHTPTKREQDQSYVHYMNFTSTSKTESLLSGGQHTEKQNGKETFTRNVDRLLAFAQEV